MSIRPKSACASVLGALLLTACAAPAPVSPRENPAALLHAGDAVEVYLSSNTGDVALRDGDAARVAGKIRQRIAAPGDAGGAAAAAASRYEVHVAIVDYSKGYDSIRAMTPYVGEIRVDALVNVVRLPDRRDVGTFMLSHRFEPSTITTSASRIADIEEPLVDSIVAALTGRRELAAGS